MTRHAHTIILCMLLRVPRSARYVQKGVSIRPYMTPACFTLRNILPEAICYCLHTCCLYVVLLCIYILLKDIFIQRLPEAINFVVVYKLVMVVCNARIYRPSLSLVLIISQFMGIFMLFTILPEAICTNL